MIVALTSSDYLTRYGLSMPIPVGWAKCSDHYTLTSEYDSYYAYNWYAQTLPHGPIHVHIGGVFDCEVRNNTWMLST